LLLVAFVVMSLALGVGPARAQTIFTVNSVGDVGDIIPCDDVCDASPFPQVTLCTFRAAIEEANTTAGADTINFNISGSGVKTISPDSELPEITERVTIDGYSQPGASRNTLKRGTNARLLVELARTDLLQTGTSADGLEIAASNSVIKGLAINRFPGSGVFVSGFVSGVTGVRVEGNFIGTDPSGTQSLGNGSDGVEILRSSGNTVGGTSPAARNLISDNSSTGVEIDGNSTPLGDNKVQGNLIGTSRDGISALGNGSVGVRITTSSGNSIGGTTAESANTIAFNTIQFFANPPGTDQGKTFLGQTRASTDAKGNAFFTFTLDRRVRPRLALTATATDSVGNTSEFSALREVLPR
jgi:hypothetical protein